MSHARVTRNALAAVTAVAGLGAGSGQFRGERASKCEVFADSLDLHLVGALVLPASLLGTVALISLPSPVENVVAGIWFWPAFHSVAGYIHCHSQADSALNDGDGFPDGEADYWRTKVDVECPWFRGTPEGFRREAVVRR